MKIPRISIIGLTTLLFIIFKVTNFVNWPWWVVLSPLWGAVVIVLVLSGIIYLVEKYE